MLGETVREARIRKGLTQAKLARMAGVSRRHLAALEKGANVSISVLKKVAAVLELTTIQLGGGISVHPGGDTMVNVPLLTDTLREARIGAMRAEQMIDRAEMLINGGETRGTIVADAPLRPPASHLPSAPVWTIGPGRTVRDSGDDWMEVRTAGELHQGQPVDELHREQVVIPSAAMEKGEIIFRARGTAMRNVGIHDGDLLIAENRPRGRANTSELVIVKSGSALFVGRWWAKNDTKTLVDEHRNPIDLPRKSVKVMAAITVVLRSADSR
jgi:transcriptional regulator with XRE-family HTH domain